MDMDFYKQYSAIRQMIAPFRKSTDFEHVKTVAVIDELINRADTLNAGADPKGRFGWINGHTVENYMTRASFYATALERGEFPLKGRFAEPGLALVDHSFVKKDGEIHLFYNRGFIGFEWSERFVDTFGHAVTKDLIHWDIKPPCLTVEKGVHDDFQIWSPGIVEKDGVYYMYYTGVNFNIAQAICLATSKDLYDWERYPENPIVTPGEWYPHPWSPEKWVDCRDSMVFIDDDGTAYMYYCTARLEDNGSIRPATGVSSSRDMYHWKDEGTFDFTICGHAPESPFLIKRNGTYYFFYTNCGKGTAYATANNPLRGWTDRGMLIETKGLYTDSAHVPSCSEVFEFKGKWYISCAERHPGCEQYLELFELTWNDDLTVTVGKRVE